MNRLISLIFLACTPLLFGQCCFNPELDFLGQGGNFRGGGGIYGWAPLSQSSSPEVVFLQGGGGFFQHQNQGVVTVGMGMRKTICSTLAFGINGFGDVSFSEHKFSYGQIGGGIEIFSCRSLFRFNGYSPFGRSRKFSSQPKAVLDGTAILDVEASQFEASFPGFDAEVGAEVCFGPGELWGYAGYFWHKRCGIKAIQGPRLRAEYRLDVKKLRAQIVFGGSWEEDRIHGSSGSVMMEVRFPYCRPEGQCASICKLMGRPVFRDRSIWLEHFSREEVDGQIGTIIFANNSNDGIGTQTDPATIENAFAAANSGDYIFLLQDTGNMTPAAPIMLDPFERVIGFGNSNQVTIIAGNGALLTITDLTGAGRGIVDGSVAVTAFEAASSTLFQGIGITMGSIGIEMMTGVSNVNVVDVNFTSQAAQSILNMEGSDLFVRDSSLTSLGVGIRESFATGILEVRNSTITALTGVQLEDVNLSRAVISHNTIAATTVGVEIRDSGGGPFVVNQCTLNGVATAILVDDDTAPGVPKDVRVLNNEMLSIGLRGIDVFISQASDIYQFNNNQIIGSDDESIRVDLNTGVCNVEIKGNEVTSNTADAIFMDVDTAATILIQGNFGTADDQLVDVDFGGAITEQGNVSILGNQMFNDTGADGYRVDRSSGTQPVCATLLGNNKIVPTDGILIDSNATPLFVFDLANLSSNNNGLGVTLLPVVANTDTRCPLPNIPPLPFPI